MDLNAPLGLTPQPRRARRGMIAGGIVLGAAAAAGAVVLVRADPHGGRPFAVAVVPPMPPPAPRVPAPDPMPTGSLAPAAAAPAPPRAGPTARAGSLEGGVMVYRGAGEIPAPPAADTPGAPFVIDVSRALDDPLGRSKGAGGATAKPPGAAKPERPRVAIFVSGLGLDAGATRTAVEIMPPTVTLAFLPYGDSIASSVDAAKAKGHEILLQLPMRNAGGAAPGPHTLRPDAPADVAKADLAWLMDRFRGYDGVVNLLGAPMTADKAAMSRVLKDVGSRHLFYLDDGTSRDSLAAELARDLNVESIGTDLLLDATGDPAVVRANLDRLVALAKRKGHAVGMASGLPEHLGTIARFAAQIASQGVDLVPVNAILHDAPVGAGSSAAR